MENFKAFPSHIQEAIKKNKKTFILESILLKYQIRLPAEIEKSEDIIKYINSLERNKINFSQTQNTIVSDRSFVFSLRAAQNERGTCCFSQTNIGTIQLTYSINRLKEMLLENIDDDIDDNINFTAERILNEIKNSDSEFEVEDGINYETYDHDVDDTDPLQFKGVDLQNLETIIIEQLQEIYDDLELGEQGED